MSCQQLRPPKVPKITHHSRINKLETNTHTNIFHKALFLYMVEQSFVSISILYMACCNFVLQNFAPGVCNFVVQSCVPVVCNVVVQNFVPQDFAPVFCNFVLQNFVPQDFAPVFCNFVLQNFVPVTCNFVLQNFAPVACNFVLARVAANLWPDDLKLMSKGALYAL